MTDTITYSGVTVDCPDPRALAAFYVEITRGHVVFETPEFVVIGSPGGEIGFQQALGHRPPAWPDQASSMQMHLDFFVDDLDASEARVLAAGAKKYTEQPNSHCRVFADPAGHPFCLSLQQTAGDLEL